MESQVDPLLDEALSRPALERESFLQNAVSGDPGRLATLMRVIAEASRDDGFLTPGGAQQGPIFEDLCEQLAHAPDVPRQSLAAGDTLGPYRIIEAIGRGGMGEVYRARDTRLSRDVAIKVLPADRLADDSRLARLRREARVLASLNDSRIAAIFDVEEHAGSLALVLEHVDGPTLADRLKSGPLPIPEALPIARQLAAAVSVAHERGIVHRDLKPANVKLLHDGTIKVLDFGLATAFRDAAEPGDGEPLGSGEHSRGAVLGTPAYMSPEQARGEPVDPRADIWAFGCLLYEMLTGRRAVAGATRDEILARVRENDLDHAEALPANVPAPVRRLLRRCLQSEASRRLGSLRDAVLEIDDATNGADEARAPAPEAASRSRRLATLAAVVVGVIVLVMWWTPRFVLGEPEPAVARLAVPGTDSVSTVYAFSPAFALSPDGQILVFRGEQNRVLKLFRRDLRQGDVVLVPGSEGAMSVFLSPDGTFVGFVREGTVMKASLAGGPAVEICETPSLTTAAWGEDGRIIFATATERALYSVREDDCDPRPVTTLDETQGEFAHAYPERLPGDRALIFTTERRDGAYIAVQRFDTGRVDTLTTGRQARYLSTGHLVFTRGSALWAVPFDVATLRLSGEPTLVESDLHLSRGVGVAHYAVSRNSGALVYAKRVAASQTRHLVWVNRRGGQEPHGLAPAEYGRVSVSPDGTRLALAMTVDNNSDIWVYEPERGTKVRVTVDPAVDTAPVWSPDGQFVVFRSERQGGGLFKAAADRAEQVERLTAPSGPLHTPYVFARGGQTLLFTEFRSYAEQRVGALDLDTRQIQWLLESPRVAQLRPDLSPDGRWLTYQSNESGRHEVYVCPYPDVKARRWQISSDGGTSPRWSRDGRELIYYDGRAFRAVPMTATDTLRVGSSRVLFEDAHLYGDPLGPIYDLSLDGQRLLLIRNPPREPTPRTEPEIRFITNWSAEIAQRLPASPRSWLDRLWRN